MAKITVTLDAQKLRNLISKRTYKNKEGIDTEVQEVKFELVEVREPKEVYSTDTYKLMKTHFACAVQTKEEREAKADTNFIGDGITTVWLNDTKVSSAPVDNSQLGTDEPLPF